MLLYDNLNVTWRHLISNKDFPNIHAHTHTQTYIYIYIKTWTAKVMVKTFSQTPYWKAHVFRGTKICGKHFDKDVCLVIHRNSTEYTLISQMLSYPQFMGKKPTFVSFLCACHCKDNMALAVSSKLQHDKNVHLLEVMQTINTRKQTWMGGWLGIKQI